MERGSAILNVYMVQILVFRINVQWFPSQHELTWTTCLFHITETQIRVIILCLFFLFYQCHNWTNCVGRQITQHFLNFFIFLYRKSAISKPRQNSSPSASLFLTDRVKAARRFSFNPCHQEAPISSTVPFCTLTSEIDMWSNFSSSCCLALVFFKINYAFKVS